MTHPFFAPDPLARFSSARRSAEGVACVGAGNPARGSRGSAIAEVSEAGDDVSAEGTVNCQRWDSSYDEH
eukprot:461608-Rhodomonas_salina.1